MKFHHQNGPQLKADFYLDQDKISKIHLSHSIGEGLVCEIIADKSSEKLIESIHNWTKDYCLGVSTQITLPFNIGHLTPFTQKILHTLLTLPFGQAVSYKELAILVSNPKASRAAGSACGRNPCPLLIPCHRVLGGGNTLGGFTGGVSIKMKLLQHEQIAYRS